jgi:hypothetical protein
LNVANGVRLVPEITATNIVLVATSVPPNPGPELNLFRDGDNLWLCWPRGYETFVLQSATSLSPPNWQTITPTELNRLILTPGSPQRFFRMVGP